MFGQTDEYYMRIALAEAAEAYEAGEIPIGAVITVNGKIIARAHNRTEALNDVTAHAEMQAITFRLILINVFSFPWFSSP